MRKLFLCLVEFLQFQPKESFHIVRILKFAFAVAMAFLYLQGSLTEGHSPLWGSNPAHKNPLQMVLLAPFLIRQPGAAFQENRAPGHPGVSGNIRWAEQYQGNDLGAQINAANSELGSGAGEIRVGRTGTVETRVTLSSNHVLHLLAPTTWKAGIQLQNGNSVIGEGCASLMTLSFASPGPLIYGKDIYNLKVSNLCAQAPRESPGSVLVRVDAAQEVEVTGCHTSNLRLSELNSSSDIKLTGNTAFSTRTDSPSGAAVNITFTQGVVASENFIQGFVHGFQWWGGDANPKTGQGAVTTKRGARDLSFIGNKITDVGGAGIWGSMGEGVVASGNIIETCGDVCLDTEGSNSVVFSNNYVKDGNNGAIATFYYNRDVLITGNTVVSSSWDKPLLRTYTTGQTAPYDRDAQVVGNHFTCLDTSPCFISSTSGLPERFVFRDNTLRNVTLFLSDANPKHIVVISGNDFLFDVVATRVHGAIWAAHTNSLSPGDPGYCDISNNTVRSNVVQPPESAAIFVYQDDPKIAPLTVVEGNHTVGLHPFPVDISVGGASPNTSVTPVFMIRNNLMGAGVFFRQDQASPRSTVKLEGNYRMDSSPIPGQ
ncbi:MAG: right-handed parallel beta-helix repeat-containing protein [Terriglobia bacterium]|jgi:hypothetical protein